MVIKSGKGGEFQSELKNFKTESKDKINYGECYDINVTTLIV